MWGTTTIRQILLITDGESNQGADPVHVARMAKDCGITVNVIGIVKHRTSTWRGEREVQEIARVGGGMCRIVEMRELAGTMQMVTQQSVQMTIQQVVNQELRAIIGKETHSLPPEKRIEVARLIEKAGDESFLSLVLLLDVSASMQEKLPKVREAIYDLAMSLEVRTGQFEVAILTFPGKGHQAVTKVCEFSQSPDLTGLINQLAVGGGTPTGPALKEAIRFFKGKAPEDKEGSQGVFSSYVV